mgnify:CR=1 FL=1
MQIIGNTDVGRTRIANEDAFKFGKFDDGTSWAVVCDGMGGVHGGKVASSTAIDIVSQKINKCYNTSMNIASIENLLLSAITTANCLVYDRGSSDKELEGMGTTIVAAVCKNGEACIAHVGDSRAYIISDGKIKLITKDHSLVQEMLDMGQITETEFEHHPRKNIITRAMGVDEKIDIEFDTVEFAENDALILCSDGLSGLLKKEKLLEMYNQYDFNTLADKYIEAANDNGGVDNITVVVMKG